MKDIMKITIKDTSGYYCAEDAYSDRISITKDSIQYEYKPWMESEKNTFRKWSYKTTSSVFQNHFKDVAVAVEEILGREEVPFVLDIGAISFTVTYDDKMKRTRQFYLPSDEFEKCFSIIKQMIPGCESIPIVLMTSEDYDKE